MKPNHVSSHDFRELISKGYFVRTQSENLEPVISNPNHLVSI